MGRRGHPLLAGLHRARSRGAVVDVDSSTGTPRRVARLDGFLTAPSKQKPVKIALAYLAAHQDVFGLSKAAIANLTLRQDYVDVEGTYHLSFVQSVGGVPVFGNGLKAHIAKNGRIIQIDGSPLKPLRPRPHPLGSDVSATGQAIVLKLSGVVNISQVVVNPSATCGDPATASTGGYRVETSPDGTTWIQAAAGTFPRGTVSATPVALAAGAGNGVRYIRYTMLTTQGQDAGLCPAGRPAADASCVFLDSTELSVYGPAA